MKLILAPMEGLADYWVRRALTDVGHYDWCVSEFVRVSGNLLPPRVFHRWCPELRDGARTRSGTPVHLQLLGSDPACMADNAVRAVALGAPAIDLNFGCPAKTVNRHRGGAVLLDEPEVVHAVTAAVRRAVPASVPVSVKMRLGNADDGRALENALAVEAAGAAWLTVHGRTKKQGYRPPAYWDRIGAIPAPPPMNIISAPVSLAKNSPKGPNTVILSPGFRLNTKVDMMPGGISLAPGGGVAIRMLNFSMPRSSG